MYNLYADKLLQTNVVNDTVSGILPGRIESALTPTKVYQLSTNYYKSLVASTTGEPSRLLRLIPDSS